MRYTLLFFYMFVSYTCTSQSKRASHWFFGYHAGLDFSGGNPVADTSSLMLTIEGCTSISDTSGKLLFYSNGEKVWDAQHNVMLNGDSLKGHHSAIQSSLALPIPGSTSKYCLVTNGYDDGIMYNIIDMSIGLNGDVVPAKKNIPLHYPSTECLTGTLHCDAYRYWILTQEPANNKLILHAYLLDSSGISTRVTSVFDQNITGNKYPSTLNFSTNGDKVAFATLFNPNVYLFDFNKQNGQLTYNDSIMLSELIYSTAFSPNDSLLYVSSWQINGYCHIYQYDLYATNTSDRCVLDSVDFTRGSPNAYGFTGILQLGPDQKIYLSRWKQTPPKVYQPSYYTLDSLDAIEHPNIKGLSCGYKRNSVYLNGRPTMIGLPNFVSNFLSPDEPKRSCNALTINKVSSKTLCTGDSATLWYGMYDSSITGIVTSIQLSDPSGKFNTHTNINNFVSNKPGQITFYIDHAIPSGTNYQLRLIMANPSDTSLPFFKLSIQSRPKIKASFQSPTCTGDSLLLICSNNNSIPITYEWYGPDSFLSSKKDPIIKNTSLSNSGQYVVEANFNGCKTKDSVSVSIIKTPAIELNYSTPLCEGDSLILNCKTDDITGVKFIWIGPDSLYSESQKLIIKNAMPQNAGKYISVASRNECSVTDTISVALTPRPSKPEIIGKYSVCQSREMRLKVSNVTNNLIYKWNGPLNFAITDTIALIKNMTLERSGYYNVKVFPPECPHLILNDSFYCEVTPLPKITATSNSPVFEYDTLKLYSGSDDNGYSYYWTGPQGYNSKQQNPLIADVKKTSAGVYKLIVQNNECIDSSFTDVEVAEHNCIFLLHPNPNDGHFTITGCTIDQNSRVRIVNSLGQIIHEEMFLLEKPYFSKNYNFSGLARGAYCLSIVINGYVINKKFIIQR